MRRLYWLIMALALVVLPVLATMASLIPVAFWRSPAPIGTGLQMDFAQNQYKIGNITLNNLPDFLTAMSGEFKRTSTATYFDANGVMQTATAGTPRFDHDPVTGQSLGILLEGPATNHNINSTMQGAGVGTL